MSSELTIQKLKEVQVDIREIKKKGVNFRDTTEFCAWRDKATKWLKLGLPYSQGELDMLNSLGFAVRRMGMGDGYDYDDQEQWDKDCDRALHLLGSAIENIELGLVPEKSSEPIGEGQRRRTSRDASGGVQIGQASTVVLGNSNTVSIVDSITVGNLLEALEKEIQAKVADPKEKEGLLQKLRGVSANPSIAQVVGQSLGHLLRTISGAQ